MNLFINKFLEIVCSSARGSKTSFRVECKTTGAVQVSRKSNTNYNSIPSDPTIF